MYIPIGPSKKQLYKIIIALLLLCYLIFLGMYKPKAATYSTYMQSANGPYTLEISGKHASFHVENSAGQQTTLFKNWGQGKVIFSYVLGNRTTPTSQINQVTLMQTDGGEFVCDIGQSTQYVDNTTLNNTITAVCDVDLQNNNGITHVIFYRNTVAGTLLVIPGLFMEIVTTEQPNVNVNVNQQEVTQAIQNSQTQIHQDIQQSTAIANDIKNTLNDSSIDSNSATDLKNNSAFQDSNGLDAIIKAPLNFIQSLTSSTCSAISLTIPYIDANVSLPCMSTVYNKALGQQLVNLIALVINGVVLYRYCLKILQIVKDSKNPNKDGLEVLDL